MYTEEKNARAARVPAKKEFRTGKATFSEEHDNIY